MTENFVPGIPEILKKLGTESVSTFYLPCVLDRYASWFNEGRNGIVNLEANEINTVHTEPYNRVNCRIFSSIDAWNGYRFFKSIVPNNPSSNFVCYRSVITNVPRLKTKLSEELDRTDDTDFVLEFDSNLNLKSRTTLNLTPEKLPPSITEYTVVPVNSYVFIHKVGDLSPSDLEKRYSVIHHHTFHSYKPWGKHFKQTIKEVLESSKELAPIQILNLHGVFSEKTKTGELDIKEVQESIEDIGFGNTSYVEFEQSNSYDIKIRDVETTELPNLKTGNFRWLILKDEA